MPYLVDASVLHQGGPRPLLHRKFSWEDGYFVTVSPVEEGGKGAEFEVGGGLKDEEEGTEGITTISSTDRSTGSKVRRKPVASSCTIDSGYSIERDINRSSVDSTASETSTLSDLSVVSSKSSVSSLSPPTRPPPPIPISMPTRPPPPIPVEYSIFESELDLPSIQPLSFHNDKQFRERTPSPRPGFRVAGRIVPFPQRPHKRSVSSPTRMKSPLQLFPAKKFPERADKRDMPMILQPARPQLQERRSSLPLMNVTLKDETDPPSVSYESLSKPLPIPPRGRKSTTSKEKAAKPISYTAMLDFIPAVRKTPSPPTASSPRLIGNNGFEIPDRLQGTKLPTTTTTTTNSKRKSSPKSSPTKTKDRKFSLSSLISQSKSPDTSPIASPIAEPLTGAIVDPAYRGGYESGSDFDTSPIEQRSPSFRPLTTPASPKRPPRPRISTDLSVVEPLNIQHVPRKQVEMKSAVDIQSAEITEILDLYLSEIIADATARGVMSSELRSYLESESPGITDRELERELERQDSMTAKEKERVSSVSLVRRALRSSLKV